MHRYILIVPLALAFACAPAFSNDSPPAQPVLSPQPAPSAGPAPPGEPAPPLQPGAEAPVERLGLAAVVERARAASARLGQLRALADASDAGLRGARAERRPLLELAASYARWSDVPELTLALPPPGGTRTIFPNLPDNYASRLGVSIPLYTGGRLAQIVRSAEREKDAARGDVAAGAADLVLEATTAYWDLVTAIESESVLKEAVASYEAHLTDTTNRRRLGMAARNDILAVQVERDRAELGRLQAANAVEVVQANLARLLDLRDGARVDPIEPLADPLPPVEDAAALVDRALERRPERAALRARIAAAEARESAARAERMPQLRLGAGYDYSDPNRRILPPEDRWRDTWDVTLSLSLRVFDSGRTAAAVAQRSAQAEAARRQLDDLEGRIRFEVQGRLLDLRTATAAVEVAERNVEAARENRRVSADRYRAGVIPSSELLDAEVALLKAGLERTDALASQRLARAALDRALGL